MWTSFDKKNGTILDDVNLKDDNNNSSNSFAIMVENDNGEYEEYTDSSSWPTGMLFNEEYSGCVDASGNTVNAALSYSDGSVSVSINESVYCYLYFDIDNGWCVNNGITNLAECVLQSENESDNVDDAVTYIKDKGTPTFSSTSTTDDGIYYAEDDYGDSYYFRGAVTDNYVYFAGYYWRIIRINGDGSVRMIYDGTSAYANGASSTNRYISSSAFNSTYVDNAYVGYMYGTVGYEESTTSTTQTLQSYYYYYGTSYSFSESAGTYTLDGTVSREIWNSDLEGMYTCRSTSATGTCTSLWKIDDYTNNYQGKYYTYTRTSSTDENNVTTYTESHGTTTTTGTFATRYYYGTDYSFNSDTGYYTLVDYAYDVYDGTGSVTDLTEYYTCGSTSYSNCSTLYYITSGKSATVANVTKHTVSSTQTYETTHENKNNSTIKTVVDNWYATNIYNKTDGTNSYDDYISDTLFCNDRSYTSGTGVGKTVTYYGAYTRLYTNKSPILTCPQQNDAFTVSDTTNGNGDLTYKVGLITADEVAFAGGRQGTSNSSYYLYIGNYFWTMSPFSFDSLGYALEWLVYSTGFLYSYGVYSSYGVRPVVNLSSEVLLSGGTGTKDDPYTVALS